MPEAQSLLIRLVMHPTNNPHLIDKLIILRGLPYEWVFKKSKYRIEHEDGSVEEAIGDRLLTPWTPDADVNIPREVRDLTEPITFVHWFPDVQFQATTGARTFHGFWEKRTVWGLCLDYSRGPQQELWTKIEEYIDKTLPRGEKMPNAVQVAKDQKSEFKTYLARRGKTLSSLEMVEMDVPIVDLRMSVVVPPDVVLKTVMTVPANPGPPLPETKAEEENMVYRCETCSQEFKNTHGLKIHKSVHKRE